MTSTFLATTPAAPGDEPRFTVFYEGGYLALWMYDRIEVNGEVVYAPEEFDPWFEQDRVFIEAVHTGNRALLLNDYADGLYSLAPVLAGWEVGAARWGIDCGGRIYGELSVGRIARRWGAAGGYREFLGLRPAADSEHG